MSRAVHLLRILSLGALLGVAGNCRPAGDVDPADLMAQLGRALPSRIIEARLSIRQPAVGCTPIPEAYTAACAFPEAGSKEYLRLAEATTRAQAVGRAGNSAAHRHLEGLALLIWSSPHEGTVEKAVARLIEAAGLAPENPDILSDLSAAHLEAARQTGKLYHLPRALDAALRALEESPEHAPGLFNVALSRERIGLSVDARPASLARVAGSLEAVDALNARTRIAAPPRSSGSPQPTAEEVLALVRDHDWEGLRRFSVASPREARTAAMDHLMPEWGMLSAEGKHDDAFTVLEALDVIGGALIDPSVRRATDEMRSAPPAGTAAGDLQQGLVAFGDGRRQHVAENPRAAKLAFELARTNLGATGSSLLPWAEFWLAAVSARLLEPQDAQALLDGILAHEARVGPALAAQSHQLAGLIQGRAGYYGRTAAHYSDAREHFAAAGELVGNALLPSLEAEIQKLLGNTRLAWDGRLAALRQLRGGSGDRETYSALLEAADAAQQEGLLRSALVLQEDGLDLMDSDTPPEFRAEALLSLAGLHLRLDQRTLAAAQVQEARELVDRVGEPRAQAWTAALVWQLKAAFPGVGELANQTRLALLDSALVAQELTANVPLRMTLLVDRSRARRAAGHPGFQEDLDAAVLLAEAIGDGALRGPDNVRFAETTRSIIDLAAEVVAEDPAAARWGLAVTERLSSIGWKRPHGPKTAEDMGHLPATPPEIIVVKFLSLPERLLVWRLEGETTSVWVIDASATELREAALGFTEAVQRAGSSSDFSASAFRFAELIGLNEVLDALGAQDLVLIPDGPLASVPLALLPGPTGSMLIAEREVTVSPSISMALARHSAPESKRKHVAATDVALIAYTLTRDEELPPLPGARAEIARVSAVHQGATVLIDSSAHPEAFLAELSRADLLHFAGHAVSGDPRGLGSYLVLGASDIDGSTGRLYVEELFSDTVPSSRIVVLTGCTSLTADRGAALGGFWGIANPLLRRGTEAVVGSLWTIPDGDAAEFAILLHLGLAQGQSPAEALRNAQLVALDTSLPPRTWGAFQVLEGPPP